MRITIPVSAGELVDKITILRVKAERIGDERKVANVRKELGLLEAVHMASLPRTAQLDDLEAELHAVNASLWDIEAAKRQCEVLSEFGPRFVELARRVYKLNDQRAAIKRQINLAVESDLIEEKSHPTVGPPE